MIEHYSYVLKCLQTPKLNPENSKRKIDNRKLADISSDLDEITKEFMIEGLKPNINKCSPHTFTEGAVCGITNDPGLVLDSEIARLENEEASLKKMLTVKQLRRNMSTLHNTLQQNDEQQVISENEPPERHQPKNLEDCSPNANFSEHSRFSTTADNNADNINRHRLSLNIVHLVNTPTQKW